MLSVFVLYAQSWPANTVDVLVLTDYVASLGPARVRALDQALRVALALG